MTRLLMFGTFSAAALLAASQGGRPAEALQPQVASLQVPAGFEVTVAAVAPLVHHPTLVGLDDRGRLFVSVNAGVNLAKAALDQQTPSAIRMLEDTNGDGVFDRSTVFADRLTFPQGALWHDGALFAGSPPTMWRFDDADGDGKADTRRAIATGFDYTGNAADIHGPFLHPSGRLFWCHGRKGHEVYDGTRLVSKATGARIWTSRPDGTAIESYAGGGMDNPAEVTFSDEGDVFGTVNLFHGNPRGDAIVHWIYGGAYPRTDQEQVLAEFKRTGELLTPAVNLGHVAPAGIMRYRSRELGAEYQDNLFHAEFNTHRIMRTILEPQGSTFTGRTEAFVTSSDPDVHFTDVLEDADGSLLIVNTGGWFTNGCPTSGLGKPEVHGTIYRVRRTGGHRLEDPRGLRLDWVDPTPVQLTDRLADSRFAVRDRAVAALAKAGDAAISALTQAIGRPDRHARLQAVWALTRIDTPAAHTVVRRAFHDADAGVRRAAAHSVFTTRDAGAAADLQRLLADSDPAVRRHAAAALGRVDADQTVSALLQALAAPGLDRTLEHALVYALIEIDEPVATAAGLRRAEPAVRRGALLALDQMPSSPLGPDDVLPWLNAADPPLRNAALLVVSRRPAWAGAVAGDLGRRLRAPLAADDLPVVRELVVRFGRDAAIQAVVGDVLARPGVGADIQRLLLDAAADTAGLQLPSSWEAPLGAALRSPDVAVVSAAIRVVRGTRAGGFDDVLLSIGRDDSRDPVLRISALQAVRGPAAGDGGGRGRGNAAPSMDDVSFALAVDLLAGPSVPVRVQAAEMLARSALTTPQLRQLAGRIQSAGPLELQALTPALGRSRETDVGLAFVEALGKSPGLAALSEGDIRRSFRNYPPEVVTASGRLVQQLLDRDRNKAARLTELATVLGAGDPGRGRQLFASGKGACLVCHRAGGAGGQLGPDLSAIGRIRSGPELLDAVVYPSDNLARGYETYTITMVDGRTLVGTVQRETVDTVELIPASGAAVVLARDQIRTRTPSPVSLMPPGLEAQFTRQELGDLVAFLGSLK